MEQVMKLEQDDLKLKRLISEMLIADIENSKKKSNAYTYPYTPEQSKVFLKTKIFKNLVEFVLSK